MPASKLRLPLASTARERFSGTSGNPSIFFEAPTYSTGELPTEVAIADVNGDGKLDIATANTLANSVSILINNGNGTFHTNVDYSVGFDPYGIVLADFNRDGKLDIAVANYCGDDPSCQSPGTVSVLLSNGDGTFQTQTQYATASEPYRVAVGDFNEDGKIDLVVADVNCVNGSSCGYGAISLLLGNGDGTFQSHIDLSTRQYQTLAISAVDLNGDGHLDLVVANACGSDATCQTANDKAGSVSVFLGNGNGSFHRPRQYQTPAYVECLTVADFNGDGVPDIATGGQFSRSVMSIFLGNGDGTFQPHVNYPVIGIPYEIVAGDFDGDGHMDLAEAGEGGLGVHFGNGDGTFHPVTGFVSGFNEGVATGDVNADGVPDLVVSNSYDGVVSVVLGTGKGHFDSSRTYPAGKLAVPYGVSVGNFNGDGAIDFATADGGDSGYDSGGINVFLNRGNGTFGQAVSYPAGRNPWTLVIADFNGDGKADIVTGDNNYSNPLEGSVSVLIGNGDGTFQAPIQFSPDGYYPNALAAGDFNSDGKLDLVVSNQQAALPNNFGNLLVFLGNGNGTFQQPSTLVNDNHGAAIVVGDFDGDGKLDFATTISQGISVFLGNGDGTFKASVAYPVGWNVNGLVAEDINHDGILDLEGAGTEYGTQSTQGEVSILLGNGDGTFQSVANYASEFTATWLAVDDFDGDGNGDIIVATENVLGSGMLGLFLGNGDGTFQPPSNYIAGFGLGQIAAADFNGDGRPDVVFANWQYGSDVGVLLNSQGSH